MSSKRKTNPARRFIYSDVYSDVPDDVEKPSSDDVADLLSNGDVKVEISKNFEDFMSRPESDVLPRKRANDDEQKLEGISLDFLCPSGSLRALINELANSFEVPWEYVFFPLFTSCAALISPCQVGVHDGWREPITFWGLVIAENGTKKSAVFRHFAECIVALRDSVAAKEGVTGITFGANLETLPCGDGDETDVVFGFYEDFVSLMSRDSSFQKRFDAIASTIPSQAKFHKPTSFTAFINPKDLTELQNNENVANATILCNPTVQLILPNFTATSPPKSDITLNQLLQRLYSIHCQEKIHKTYLFTHEAILQLQDFKSSLESSQCVPGASAISRTTCLKFISVLIRTSAIFAAMKTAVKGIELLEDVSVEDWNWNVKDDDVKLARHLLQNWMTLQQRDKSKILNPGKKRPRLMIDRSNDRTHDRSNDRMNDRSNDRTNDRSNDRMHDRSNDRLNDRSSNSGNDGADKGNSYTLAYSGQRNNFTTTTAISGHNLSQTESESRRGKKGNEAREEARRDDAPPRDAQPREAQPRALSETLSGSNNVFRASKSPHIQPNREMGEITGIVPTTLSNLPPPYLPTSSPNLALFQYEQQLRNNFNTLLQNPLASLQAASSPSPPTRTELQHPHDSPNTPEDVPPNRDAPPSYEPSPPSTHASHERHFRSPESPPSPASFSNYQNSLSPEEGAASLAAFNPFLPGHTANGTMPSLSPVASHTMLDGAILLETDNPDVDDATPLDATEVEVLVRQAGHKIKKLLEYHINPWITASQCAQRHLMPPISKRRMSIVAGANYDKVTRYPVCVAKAWLKKMARMGFGIVEGHGGNTGGSKRTGLYFRKHAFAELGEEQQRILKTLRITKEDYDRAFAPKPPQSEAGTSLSLVPFGSRGGRGGRGNRGGLLGRGGSHLAVHNLIYPQGSVSPTPHLPLAPSPGVQNQFDAQNFPAPASPSNGFSMKLIPGYSKWKLKDIMIE